jgi:hypothetical protein
MQTVFRYIKIQREKRYKGQLGEQVHSHHRGEKTPWKRRGNM